MLSYCRWPGMNYSKVGMDSTFSFGAHPLFYHRKKMYVYSWPFYYSHKNFMKVRWELKKSAPQFKLQNFIIIHKVKGQDADSRP